MVKNRHQLVAWDTTLNLLWTWHSRLRRYQVTKKIKKKKSFILKATTTTHGAEVGHHMTKIGESWAAYLVADMLMLNRTNGKEKIWAKISSSAWGAKVCRARRKISFFPSSFFSLFAPHEKISIRPESPPISSNRRRRDPSTCYVKKWLSLTLSDINRRICSVKIIKKRTHNFSACHGLMIAIIKKVDDFRNKKRKWKARQSLSRADERGLHDKRKLTFDRSQKKVFPLSLTPPCSWKVLIKCCVNFIFGRDFLFGWGRPLFSVVCEKLKLQLRS